MLAETLLLLSSRRRHARLQGDWSSDVCSTDLRGRGLRVRWWTRRSLRLRGRRAGAADREVGGAGRAVYLQIGRASWRERAESAKSDAAVAKLRHGHNGGRVGRKRRRCLAFKTT